MLIVKNLIIKIILLALISSAPIFLSASDLESDKYHEMIKGNINAELTIVEYASFTCPHCATFHSEVFPYLKKKYIDTGMVKFVYREVYFDAPGLWAGLLARCSDSERYFGIVDLLYKKQEKWAFEKSDKETLEELFAIGRQVGMKEERINSCLQNKNKSLNLIDAYLKNSKSDDITSTPSLIVQGQLVKYSSFDELKSKIDKILN